MAVAAYTNDLTLIQDFEDPADPDLAEFVGYTAGRGQALSTDYPIQGATHADAVCNNTGQSSMSVDNGSAISWTTGHTFFSWLVWTAPGAIATQANGGFVFIVGADLTNYDGWYVGGSDFGSYPYGGWQNFAVDPEIQYSEQGGTGNGASYRYVGLGVDVTPTAVAKGSPLGIDALRYGRGELRIVGGTSTDPDASFTGMAAANDSDLARWGLFQEVEGGYKWKGLMYFGYGNPTNFTDSNISIVVDNTEFVQPEFNRIEIHNASSIINWTNINITALGTVSPGDFEMMDNATLNDIGGVFTDMGTFIYQSNATITGRTYRRCDQVYWGDATFDGCIFESTSASAAIYTEDLTDIDNCVFTGADEGNNAIHMGAAGEYTFVGNTFTGYGASASPSAAIYHDSGGHLIINVQGGDSPSVYNVGGSTAEVNNPVILTLSGIISGSEVRIYEAGTQTEVAGVETSTTTFDYPYTYAAETYVDIVVHNVQYVYYRIDDFLLSDTSGSIPIQQQYDRWYSNP